MEKFLSTPNLSIFERAIGKNSLQYFNKSKVFFSSLIYTKNFDNFIFQRGNIILKNFSNPFLEDWKVYLTLRANCKLWITTAKMLRDEKDLNTYHNFDFFGQEDLRNFFYEIDDKKDIAYSYSGDSNSCRKVFIMSNTVLLKEIHTLKFFQEKKIQKYLMSNDNLTEELKSIGNLHNFKEFFIQNKIILIDRKFKDIKDAVVFCQNNLKIKDRIY